MLVIKMDRREIDRALKDMPGQALFAVSTAINETLKKAQAGQRQHQRDVFEVRNARFMDQAVKIKPFATKASLSATIQIDPPGGAARRDILTKFEAGGRKRPISGRNIAIPELVRRSTKSHSGGLKPSALGFTQHGRSGKVFTGANRTILIRTGRGGLILQRTGKGRARSSNVRTRRTSYRGRRSGLKLLYVLTPSAHIPPTLQFEATVRSYIGTYAEREAAAAWLRAVRTAR